jgi:hypothetical protein
MIPIEVRPMAHPTNKWGVYHIGKRKFIASYPQEIQAFHFAWGYLEEHFRMQDRRCPPPLTLLLEDTE